MPMSETAFREWMDDAERHPRLTNYKIYENYWLGNYEEVPLPTEIAEMLGVDLVIRANMCSPIVNVKTQYILGGDVTIEASGDEIAEERLHEAEAWLYDIYRKNKLLYNNMLKLIRGTSIKGDGFIRISLPEDTEGELKDRVKVRVLAPRMCFPKYQSDDYEEMELCAVKGYDYSDSGEVEWRAQVWYPDVLEIWKLDTASPKADSQDTIDHEWWKEDELDNPFGFVPIVHFPNIINDQEFGVSDLHNVTTLQLALLKYLTDEAITADFNAYPRVYITGALTISGKELDVSPGTVTEIPDAEARVTEVAAGDLKAYIDAIEQTVDLMCQVTQTPNVALGRVKGGQAPSGYALEVEFQPLKAKTAETMAILKDGLSRINGMLMKIGIDKENLPFAKIDAEVNFNSGLPMDKDSIVKTHKLQIESETLSRKSAMKEEGIEDTEDEQEQIDAEKYNVSGRERVAAETDELRQRLESEEELTARPRPGEVSEAERRRARETPTG